MGQFANTIFSALLGWVQTAASWLWALISAPESGGWLRWLLDNWLPLLLMLCAAERARIPRGRKLRSRCSSADGCMRTAPPRWRTSTRRPSSRRPS